MRVLFKNKIIFKMIMMVGLFFLLVAANSSTEPLTILKESSSQIKQLSESNSILSETKRDSILRDVVSKLFDFAYMGEKALGKKKYKTLSSGQKEQFSKFFPLVILKESVQQLKNYKSDSLIYGDVSFFKKKTRASIEIQNYYNDEETVLKYKMYITKNGQWKAWDLVTDDLSTYRSYKEQFKRILSKNDFDHLIKLLEKKL